MRAPQKTFTKARNLRREMTLPEVLLWRDLRRRAAENLRFRRQHSVGPYIIDFFCTSAALAVEIDGATHDHPDQVARDRDRDRWLANKGMRMLRFNAVDILDDERRLDVIATIVATAAAPSTTFGGPPPPLRG